MTDVERFYCAKCFEHIPDDQSNSQETECLNGHQVQRESDMIDEGTMQDMRDVLGSDLEEWTELNTPTNRTDATHAQSP